MISIIIPIMNEPYIYDLVSTIIRLLDKEHHFHDYEIIIVEKIRGSIKPITRHDGWDKVWIINQATSGLGNAILEGLQHCEGDKVVTMDGDGSHMPEDLWKLIELSARYDIVLGSKYTDGGISNDSRFRWFISNVSCIITRALLGLKVDDPMTGFSIAKKSLYDSTELNPFGYKIVLELLYKNKQATVFERPILFLPRQAGKSKFGIKEFIRTGLFVVKLRLGI